MLGTKLTYVVVELRGIWTDDGTFRPETFLIVLVDATDEHVSAPGT